MNREDVRAMSRMQALPASALRYDSHGPHVLLTVVQPGYIRMTKDEARELAVDLLELARQLPEA